MNFASKLISTVGMALLASAALAQTPAQDHKAHHPNASASTPAVKAKAALAPASAASGGMHGHMDKHCKEMRKIMAIKNADKRQKAMAEHMNQHMKDGKCDMMEGGMGGMGGGGMGASAPEGMQPGMDKGMAQ